MKDAGVLNCDIFVKSAHLIAPSTCYVLGLKLRAFILKLAGALA